MDDVDLLSSDSESVSTTPKRPPSPVHSPIDSDDDVVLHVDARVLTTYIECSVYAVSVVK